MGEIKHAPGTEFANLVVELSDPVKQSSSETAIVAAGGDFEFDGIVPGMYVVRVLTMSGTPLPRR